MPTLGFIVERYLLIKNFNSEKFWYLQLVLFKKQDVKLEWDRHRLFDKLNTQLFLEKAKEHQYFKVTKVEKKKKIKFRP